MIPISLSDNLHIGGRILHLQTQIHSNETTLDMTLFIDGQVLNRRKVAIPSGKNTLEIKDWTDRKHQEAIDTLLFLFSIDAKVRSVKHGLSLNYLGTEFLHWGFRSEAVEVLEMANIYSEDYDTIDLFCDALILNGNPERAVSIVSNFLEKETNKPQLWQKRGEAYLASKQYENAIADFKQAAQSCNPVKAHFYIVLSTLLKINTHVRKNPDLKEEIQMCIQLLEEAVSKSGQMMQHETDAIVCNLKSGELERAIQDVSALIHQFDSAPDLSFHHIFYLQFFYGKNGRDSDHIKQYVDRLLSAIKYHPENHHLRFLLGTADILLCQHHIQKAINEFNGVMKTAPEISKYRDSARNTADLGEVYIRLVKKLMQSYSGQELIS